MTNDKRNGCTCLPFRLYLTRTDRQPKVVQHANHRLTSEQIKKRDLECESTYLQRQFCVTLRTSQPLHFPIRFLNSHISRLFSIVDSPFPFSSPSFPHLLLFFLSISFAFPLPSLARRFIPARVCITSLLALSLTERPRAENS